MSTWPIGHRNSFCRNPNEFRGSYFLHYRIHVRLHYPNSKDTLLCVWLIICDNSNAIMDDAICKHLGTSSSNMAGQDTMCHRLQSYGVPYTSLMFNLTEAFLTLVFEAGSWTDLLQTKIFCLQTFVRQWHIERRWDLQSHKIRLSSTCYFETFCYLH